MKKKQLKKDLALLQKKLARRGSKVSVAKAAATTKKAMPKISDEVLSLSMQSAKRVAELSVAIFAAAKPMPGVVPKANEMAMDASLKLSCEAAAMALDQQIIFAGGWAGGYGGGQGYGAFAEGQAFLGYPYLSELAQRPEYRTITETMATEMFRKGVKVKASGKDGNKEARVKELEKELDRLKLVECLTKVSGHDGYFGRGHIYMDFDDASSNPAELLTPVGDGLNEITAAKVKKGSLKRLQVVEPVWCYPTAYNSTNPLLPNWYKPDAWFAMGNQVHSSRFLTFIGREVPDVLKPAYSFGGLSMSQMAKPYVDNWLRTRQSVSDLLHSFTTWCLSTNMAETLTPGGDQLFRRVQLFNNLRDNKGLMMTDKDTEEFENISAPLGTLDMLQAQAQEQMASVSHQPLVKAFGIQPAGLNASSDGEIRVWYDYVVAFRQLFICPNLDRIFRFAQINIWGVVDPEMTYEFPSLYEMDEKQRAEIRKIDADTDGVLVEIGAVDAVEVRARVAADEASPHSSLDLTKIPAPPVEETSSFGIGQGGGLTKTPNEFEEAA